MRSSLFKSVRSVRFPRPPRLYPSGVTYEPALMSDARCLLVLRLNGVPQQEDETKGFHFQQAVTAQS